MGSVPIDMGGDGDPGKVLPWPLLNGYEFSEPSPIAAFNEDELSVIALKDEDENTVDVFYVSDITNPGNNATAYGVARNHTGNADGQNFVIVQADHEDLTLAHEMMHILLNEPHRFNEPTTALFHAFSVVGKPVDGRKRIGPYPDAAANNVGNDDTFDIRETAEDLPD
jgi:hypothetical protein